MSSHPPNRLAELRDARKMKQSELARRSGIAESQVSRHERGQAPLYQNQMMRYAVGLECAPWEIFPEWTQHSPVDHMRKMWALLDDAERTALRAEFGVVACADAAEPLPARPKTIDVVAHFSIPISFSLTLAPDGRGNFRINQTAGANGDQPA